jgi:hypothetical protein
MLEIAELQRQIELQRGDMLKSFVNDFILPLEAKVEGEEKALAVLEKNYRDDCELRLQMVEQAEEQLKDSRKQFRKDHPGVPYEDERDRQMQERLRDYESDLYDVRSYGLKKALLLERKIHCTVVDRFCAVMHNDMIYHGKSHNGLSRKLTDWSSLVADPNDILPETEELLRDPNPPSRNKWLEDDTRNLLGDDIPLQRFRRTTDSADTTMTRPQHPRERNVSPPTSMRSGWYQPDTSISQLNLNPVAQPSALPQFLPPDRGIQGPIHHQPHPWAVDELDTATHPQNSRHQIDHLPLGGNNQQVPPGDFRGVTPLQQGFDLPQGIRQISGMGQQPQPSVNQSQRGTQQSLSPQNIHQQYPLTVSAGQHGSPQMLHQQQKAFNQAQEVEQPSQPLQQQLPPAISQVSQPIPLVQPLGVQQPLQLNTQTAVQQPFQPLQQPQPQLLQPQQPVQQIVQQPVAIQPQTVLQQQPVQVRAHPQTVFIQQPLGQRMQPQTIAVSQLTKPKYGARVRALYTYQASSSSQLAFKSGDLIDAVGTPKDGWQYGENCRTGKSGWFPSNYVERLVAVRDQRVNAAVPQYVRRSPTNEGNVRPTIPAPDYGNENRGAEGTSNNTSTPPLTSSPARTNSASPGSQVSPSSQTEGALTATVTAITTPLVVSAPILTPTTQQQPVPQTSITQFRRLEQFE